MGRLALGFCGVALALIIQELGVRLTLPDYNPNNHLRFNPEKPDLPVLGPANGHFRQVKNSGDYNVSVVFNEHGLRDLKDLSTATDKDVILVGDSFAFGWGVEQQDRVSERLEKLIGRRVFNVAVPTDVPGYDKLLRYARARGSAAKDVIILLNMYDDINDYDIAAVKPVVRSEAARPPPGTLFNLNTVKGFLLEHSSLYFLATSVLGRIQWFRAIAVKVGLIVPLSEVHRRDLDRRAVKSTLNSLKKIAETYRVVIMVIPSRGLWIGNNQASERQIHDALILALERSGLNYIDMRRVQERDGNPMRYHFVNDGHWRPVGHELAAKALAWQLLHTTKNLP